MKKVLLISEYLDPPFDEGIKKTALHLFNFLNENYTTLTLSRKKFEHPNIKQLHTNRLFLSRSLRKEIISFNPDVIIYLPFQSGTFASYLRQFTLRLISRNCKVIFYTLQPKYLSSIKKLIINFIKPSTGITASPEVYQYWENLKIDSTLVPLYTNLNKFAPNRDTALKNKLRAKYNLPIEAFIITHVGHLNEGRNLETLIPLNTNNNQVVIIGSSSTPDDALGTDSLKQKLINSGLIIIEGFIENIQEIYHLSDLYIFPVIDNCGSIGMPLSILEARTCGIPVLTTDYGSIKKFLQDDNNGIFYSDPQLFNDVIQRIDFNEYKQTNVSKLNDIYCDTFRRLIEEDDA